MQDARFGASRLVLLVIGLYDRRAADDAIQHRRHARGLCRLDRARRRVDFRRLVEVADGVEGAAIDLGCLQFGADRRRKFLPVAPGKRRDRQCSELGAAGTARLDPGLRRGSSFSCCRE
jgi:hypothetical protein